MSTERERTQVVSFELNATSLNLKVARPSHRIYGDTTDPTPADIPPDYLAAINEWIARLR